MLAPRDSRWMQTFSGLRFYPADPRPQDICIEDIAHHLSLMNRFTGATRYAYSVAQHAINCAIMADGEHALEALLHDATEAYIADINSPAKSYLPDYKVMEARLYRVVANKFGFPVQTTDYVKVIDTRMLVTEAAHLMREESYSWWNEDHWPEQYDLDIVNIVLDPMSPKDVEAWFLELFDELTE